MTNLWPIDPAELCEHLQAEEEVECAQRERIRLWNAELASMTRPARDRAKNRAKRRYDAAMDRAGNAMPTWLTKQQKDAIFRKYEKAVERQFWTGDPYEVHHIIALFGKLNQREKPIISGLHVPWNLQVTTRYENRSLGATVPSDLLGGIDFDPFASIPDDGDDKIPF